MCLDDNYLSIVKLNYIPVGLKIKLSEGWLLDNTLENISEKNLSMVNILSIIGIGKSFSTKKKMNGWVSFIQRIMGRR